MRVSTAILSDMCETCKGRKSSHPQVHVGRDLLTRPVGHVRSLQAKLTIFVISGCR